ncbi:MAG: SpoIIE family protein phosphatase [Kiritimatiellales bacterium]|nr:SpoIIE family protein phosphatase [Kiritimatiellales bacterium]
MLSDMDEATLLTNLMEKSSDGIYFKDMESKFILVNHACANKHKYASPDQMIGKNDFDHFSREHAEQAYADEQRIIQTGIPLSSIEEKETWEDGSETWVSTTKMPLRDEAGSIIGTFGISRDITDRKQAEFRVRRYAEEISAIKEEMENDVVMAGELQKSFFPSTYPDYPEGAPPEDRCVEFLHRFNLNSDVSGDYCAINRISDHEAGIFLCEVGGMGLRAALGTALIRGIMQEISDLAGDPGAYLGRMSMLLAPLLRQESLQLSASACYMVIDLATGEICTANAGHPMPIYLRDGYAAEWLCKGTTCVGPALAAQADAHYNTVVHQIAPGDSVVMFSDGLYRATNKIDDEYGLKRLFDSAHSLAGESLIDIFDGLEGDALAFSRDGKFSDDVCIVGFRLNKLMS